MKVYITDENGKVFAEIKNCKTIKGAMSQIKKTSIAVRSGWKIIIEETVK